MVQVKPQGSLANRSRGWKRGALRLLHPVAGTVALVTVSVFWTSTVLSELFASEAAIAAVKTAIAWGLLLLVPALALAGGSGAVLAGPRRAGNIARKKRRMAWAAANGMLVLLPSALFLAAKAQAGAFDAAFYAVQFCELVAGAVNMMLLGLNMRDGLKMRRPDTPMPAGRVQGVSE